jgi:hypothetical protein
MLEDLAALQLMYLHAQQLAAQLHELQRANQELQQSNQEIQAVSQQPQAAQYLDSVAVAALHD